MYFIFQILMKKKFIHNKKIIYAIILLFLLTSCSTNYNFLRGPLKSKDTLTILAVGDISHSHTSAYIDEFRALGRKKYNKTKHILRSADLTFANLESPYTKVIPTAEKQFAFASDPKELDHLIWAGFNLFSLANNHSFDVGAIGIHDTLSYLEQKKDNLKNRNKQLIWAGIGRTKSEAEKLQKFSLNKKNFDIAFLAYANNKNDLVNSFNLTRAIQEIQSVHKKNPDAIIIVSVHSGKEYEHIPRDYIISSYRKLVNAGATIILGHHPHVIQGIEHYKNGIICYSLGNFSFGTYTSRHKEFNAHLYSMIVAIQLKNKKNGTEVNLLVLPIYVDNLYTLKYRNRELKPTPFIPQVVRYPFSKIILNSIKELSEIIPGNNLKFSKYRKYLKASFIIDKSSQVVE